MTNIRATHLLHRRIAGSASPLRIFETLYHGERHAFLYESLADQGRRGRYSFLGGRPRLSLRAMGKRMEIHSASGDETVEGELLDMLRTLLAQAPEPPHVSPFAGGLVGYFAYDVVRQFERLPHSRPDALGVPDAYFLVPDELIVLDHVENCVDVVLYGSSASPERLDQILHALSHVSNDPARNDAQPISEIGVSSLTSNMTRAEFESAVRNAGAYIRDGDVFQVVLSQRFETGYTGDPLRLYRALRVANPSPYMYYLALDDHHVLGSSPEVLVKLEGRKATTRPLAGTRPRGHTPEADEALARELRADAKEAAEHVMLVDLARNDLGRVCDYGSVRVGALMQVERHPRVMHLVSTVEGRLRNGYDAFDIFRAAFPAGTVSGAPKCRAMELIDELEATRRGIYAGAIGYFDARGGMDLCIAIRTMVVKDGKAFLQAGAGVVADSQPEREYQETLDKARGLVHALQQTGVAP